MGDEFQSGLRKKKVSIDTNDPLGPKTLLVGIGDGPMRRVKIREEEIVIKINNPDPWPPVEEKKLLRDIRGLRLPSDKEE